MLLQPSRGSLAECKAGEANACVLTLHGSKGPTASASCTGELWQPHLAFEQPDRFVDHNGDGWWETVLEIDLSPEHGCSCVTFRVHFGSDLQGFLVHVGDSATNDGFGGDAGTDPIHSAELQVRHYSEGSRLNVYSASGETPGQDALLSLNLPDLQKHFVQFEICDQFLAFAIDGKRDDSGAGWMRTLDSQRLFAIARAGEASQANGSPTMDPWIYAAFNRVVHERAGPAARGRIGRGVVRVEMFLTP